MAALVVAALAAVPLACGSGLTKTEFINRGDAICKRLTDESRKVTQPTSAKDIEAYLAKVLALTETARADLAKLHPPKDGDKVHAALVAAMADTIGTARRAKAAAGAGDMQAVQQLLGEAGMAAIQASKPAKSYGFTDCAAS
ncbi:MAG: hypothetical protein JWO68_3281 [Actinomycetia bacterium]|nr:hypothetical protein [Actinomycetes bacterium]